MRSGVEVGMQYDAVRRGTKVGQGRAGQYGVWSYGVLEYPVVLGWFGWFGEGAILSSGVGEMSKLEVM